MYKKHTAGAVNFWHQLSKGFIPFVFLRDNNCGDFKKPSLHF